MNKHYAVIVIGGGQAGLAMSYNLKQGNVDHLVFEKNRIGHAWRSERWDSFCLVTPNWQCRLPSFPYQGDDSHGFMEKDEIVKYVEDYANSFDAPVKEGVEVSRVRQSETAEVFEISSSLGDCTADQVVIATGAYHRPNVPRAAERLPDRIMQLHSSEYRNPQSLPQGSVLIVGTGQSGCQIAEDLHFAGRQVHLSVGNAPRSPRLYRGKDVVAWLEEMGYYDLPIDEHPKKDTVRTKTNHYVTGRDGGREIDLRKLALEGMRLYGRFNDIRDGYLKFGNDLKENLDHADEVAESIKTSIDNYIKENQIDTPKETPYVPVWEPSNPLLELGCGEAGITAIVWCTGFKPDFSWIEIPVFDGKGYPGHKRGVTGVRGLYFLGLPWLYTWGSGRFSGIAQDAAHVADRIALNLRARQPRAAGRLNVGAIGS